ncbi:DNA-directed RNA polymerase subunit delta [Candidatus Phytoplasma australiense]|uniref:RNAP delta factor n=1 Tax=Strawberry lethal yellows phytoplasma (CPA) str. NZSb11 TaxID=980422 RepID=R4RLZ5_PHYAS|nr:DNA-directed RNA polymerase subunit delta [Candidatus Phytoplasma australiense]AGL90355.1 hypothetical protein SLY_0435 [Strawberry lethal yellows phytoplasma (CPA) str. NZSb11]
MKKTKKSKSLLETAYEIAKKQNKPIYIFDLLEQTQKKHQIEELKDYKKINQLYLDITLSGQFVFCDEKHLIIKENHKEHWDKDFFEKPKNNQEEDSELQKLDLEDVVSEKPEDEDEDTSNKDDELLKNDDHDEVLDEDDKEEDSEDLSDDYEYFL